MSPESWIEPEIATSKCTNATKNSSLATKLLTLVTNRPGAAFSKRFWRVGYLLGGIGWVTAICRKILWGVF